MTSTIRIYVACLASYNNGRLHGAWIDADQDADQIQSEIAGVLRTSPCPSVTVDCPTCDGTGRHFADDDGSGLSHPEHNGDSPACEACKGKGKIPSAEEYAIHDHEGFGEIKIGESESIAKIAALATAIDEHGEAFIAWYANGTADEDAPATWADAFTESYCGTFRTIEDYAENFLDDTGFFGSHGGGYQSPAQKRGEEERWQQIRNYFDFAAWARDCELNGDIWTAPGGDGVLVFDNH